jgi:hypothetical protein
MSFQLTEFKLTEQQTHAIIIVVLLIVAIILLVLVVKAAKKENFRYRGVGIGNGLAARLRGVGIGNGLAARLRREGFEITPSNAGSFNYKYSDRIDTREGFASGDTNQGAAGLKVEGFSPMIDTKSVKSHLRTKQRIIY